ncbi:MAG: hypothetical protein WBA74_25885, partial [Cyclobacteriaceae bacterium]
MNKSESQLLGIVIINFLLPPIIVILILFINGTLPPALLETLITSWPLYVFISPFMIGLPLVYLRLMKRIRRLKAENNPILSTSYVAIQILFVTTSIFYGMTAVPIARYNAFDSRIELFLTITAFFYLFNAVPPMLLLFNRKLDKLFSDTSIKVNFSFKLKFRMVAIFSALGGVG